MNDLKYLIALHSVDGIGSVRLLELLARFGSAKAAWEAPQADLIHVKLPPAILEKLLAARQDIDPGAHLEHIFNSGIKIVTKFDPDYPELLLPLPDSPLILYFKGVLPKRLDHPLAIVGTRHVTSYGKSITDQFATSLTAAGCTIVSGLARGVDTIAHQSCLQSAGVTIAVLGGGLNKLYPQENAHLANKIIASGGALVSEYYPETPPFLGNFPARNRIIAGLSLATLVTEAADKSGSLITANLSLEYGRDVYAIPGQLGQPQSAGTNRLIQQGAKLVLQPQDILDDFGITPARSPISFSADSLEGQILEQLSSAATIDELTRKLKRPSAEIGSGLIRLEIQGQIKNVSPNTYVKLC